ncbi:MAG: alpha/beta fold hydrolase [Balneolaceae bacterium]
MSQVPVHKQSGEIFSTEELPIRYDLYVPARSNREQLPVVLFLHGFKGFKDWGPFPDACEDLARIGFAVVALNFSRNGVGENPLEFGRLDLFEKETLSQDLEDVGSVIQALKRREIASERVRLDSERISVIGHSRGGHTAVAAAAEYSEIQCLVTWSAVADYNARWGEKMIRDWEKDGVTEIKNARTGQVMKMDLVIYEDAQKNADRLMALNRVKELYLPALFLAGREDESVPWRDSEKLYKACPSEIKEFRLIPSAGHTFGGAHPFEAEEYPEPFQELMEQTEKWLQDNVP